VKNQPSLLLVRLGQHFATRGHFVQEKILGGIGFLGLREEGLVAGSPGTEGGGLGGLEKEELGPGLQGLREEGPETRTLVSERRELDNFPFQSQ